MQQLEKILEEIDDEIEKERAICEGIVDTPGWRLYEKTMGRVKEIIQGHMDDIPENTAGKNSWVPVEERLPEDAEDVIATTENGEEITLAWYCGEDWRSAIDGDSINVIAWMPLPEPYREDEVEKDEENM